MRPVRRAFATSRVNSSAIRTDRVRYPLGVRCVPSGDSYWGNSAGQSTGYGAADQGRRGKESDQPAQNRPDQGAFAGATGAHLLGLELALRPL